MLGGLVWYQSVRYEHSRRDTVWLVSIVSLNAQEDAGNCLVDLADTFEPLVFDGKAISRYLPVSQWAGQCRAGELIAVTPMLLTHWQRTYAAEQVRRAEYQRLKNGKD
jgi:hypothetical protein